MGSDVANDVIPEHKYEDSDSDGDEGVILSKTERRRLNMLADKGPSSAVLAAI